MAVLHRKPLPESQFAEFEAHLGILLPREYKQFLIKYNGIFLTDPDYFDLPLSKIDDGKVAFAALLGYRAKNKNLDLISVNKEPGDELVFLDHPLIIGDDNGGNYYVMASLDGEQQILYWDRTHLHSEDSKQEFDVAEVDDCGNLYVVSRTFKDFVDRIFENIMNSEFVVDDD
jgi:hypothetical protein